MIDHAATLRPLLLALAANPDMPRSAREQAADAADAADLEAVLARTAKTLVALEAAVSAAEGAARELRDTLCEVMVETGAPTISIGTHTVGVSETRRVIITDKAAIPPSLMTARDPVPDTQAIRAALERGGTVPGALLGNAAPSLFIRARK